MKALYFDCASGISGNMTLGALLELMDDPAYLQKELDKLHVDGYHLEITKQIKNGITGTHVEVVLEENHHHHDHDHHEHHHAHRHLADIYNIIDDSEIDAKSKELAKRIFLRVAKAESKVHNEPLDHVHFHEVGAVDSIVDIIGTAILITKINPDVIYSSVVNDGHGFITCAHGMIPVPVPATSEIFAAGNVVFKQVDIDTEMVTPTGAAIIAELASSFGPMPAMKTTKVGWGCGTKDFPIPNVLKVMMGECGDSDDEITIMETNIDDCTGEFLAYTMEQLFEQGAKDVFFTPIFMKKGRPAYRLSVACAEADREALADILFAQTSTIGIRYRKEQRMVLAREIREVKTPLGTIRFKCCDHKDTMYLYPEFEDLKKIAQEQQKSIKEVYELAMHTMIK